MGWRDKGRLSDWYCLNDMRMCGRTFKIAGRGPIIVRNENRSFNRLFVCARAAER